jgi:hypothetical protein
MIIFFTMVRELVVEGNNITMCSAPSGVIVKPTGV